MKKFVVVWVLVTVLATVFVVQAAPMSVKLQFVNHLQAKLPEQDVFLERVSGSGEVYRVTADSKDMNTPLFAAAESVKHNPFDAKANGPYKKGKALGLTLAQWLAATGTGTYTCANGQGTVAASFKKLVPNATYTMWYFFLPMPPTQPFTGTLDLPLGARDGSQNFFKSDAQGNANFKAAFKPCLQLTGDQLASGLAIAWHSDGKTYNSDAGPFGASTHVHLFLLFPGPKGK
jgi:hypothetical protein